MFGSKVMKIFHIADISLYVQIRIIESGNYNWFISASDKPV